MAINRRRCTPPPPPVGGGARARRPPVIYELSAGGTSHQPVRLGDDRPRWCFAIVSDGRRTEKRNETKRIILLYFSRSSFRRPEIHLSVTYLYRTRQHGSGGVSADRQDNFVVVVGNEFCAKTFRRS